MRVHLIAFRLFVKPPYRPIVMVSTNSCIFFDRARRGLGDRALPASYPPLLIGKRCKPIGPPMRCDAPYKTRADADLLPVIAWPLCHLVYQMPANPRESLHLRPMPYGADAGKARESAIFARAGAGGGGLRTPASRDGHTPRSAKISKAQSTFT